MVNISTNLRIFIYLVIVLLVFIEINKAEVNLIISSLLTVVVVFGYFGIIRTHS